jgi:hypothetical protein
VLLMDTETFLILFAAFVALGAFWIVFAPGDD